jgi:translation initiation factor 2 subunit 1
MGEINLRPQVGSSVIAKVIRVAQFGAYCKLPEYNDIDVFLPIREVSSGWIKNIHEFVHNGQIVVCKVIYIDKEKGTIDVSIKKITNKESKEKLNTYNLEKRLSALFQQAMKKLKIIDQTEKDKYVNYIMTDFGGFTQFMQNASENSEQFKKSAIPKKLKDMVLKLLESNKKEKVYKVIYTLSMVSYNTKKGISDIKNILSEIEGNGVSVEYISAPKYRLVAEAEDYIIAENKIKDSIEVIKNKLKEGKYSLEKEKLKKEKTDILNTL